MADLIVYERAIQRIDYSYFRCCGGRDEGGIDRWKLMLRVGNMRVEEGEGDGGIGGRDRESYSG